MKLKPKNNIESTKPCYYGYHWVPLLFMSITLYFSPIFFQLLPMK